MSQAAPQKMSGCLKAFLWFFGILFSLAIIGILSAWFLFNHYMNKLRDNYTSETPTIIVHEDPSAQQKATLQKTYNDLRSALKENRQASFEISGKDINAFFANAPETKDFAKLAMLQLEGETVIATLALPLNDFGIEKFNGRYLNGVFTFKPELRDGQLNLTFLDCRVNGQSLPATLVQALQQHNWNQSLKDKAGLKELDRFKSIIIKDSTLHLETK